jgi:hypothetical protein
MLADKTISNGTKLLLHVVMADMDAKGYLSIPRTELARRLNVQRNRITERIAEAKDHGYLDTVSKGVPGRTSQYVATMPSSGPVHGPSEWSATRTLMVRQAIHHDGPLDGPPIVDEPRSQWSAQRVPSSTENGHVRGARDVDLEEQPQPTTRAGVAWSTDATHDVAYDEARLALARIGPNMQAAYMEQAKTNGAETTRDITVTAAAMARTSGVLR